MNDRVYRATVQRSGDVDSGDPFPDQTEDFVIDCANDGGDFINGWIMTKENDLVSGLYMGDL